jgi:hypothetical protein
MDIMALLSVNRWNPDGFRPQPATERVWPILSSLNPSLVTSLGGEDITPLHDLRTPSFEGSLMAFNADKLEKMVVGNMCFMRKLTVFFVTIYPEDNYDFPVVASDLTEGADHAAFIFDFHALADIVVNTAYREKYLDKLDSIWKEYLDLDNRPNPASWYRALMSPFDIFGRYPTTGSDRSQAARALDCQCKYLKYYCDLVRNAAPVPDPAARQYAVARREAIKAVFREKDPGLAPLSASLGAETARKWAKIVY